LWLSDKYNLYRFEWVQNAYSLLDRTDEREILPLCQDQQLGYTPFSPLAGGWLTGKYQANQPFPTGSRMTLRPEPYQQFLNERTFRSLNRLQAYAAERGTDMATLALAWVMAQPLVTAPIIGPRRLEHFEPVQRALEIKLTMEECQKITDIMEG
jgi:aryl-alcohol dehydrogenase-like predicted oxidoreductase